MTNDHRRLLKCYTAATLPLRKFALARMGGKGTAPLAILFYHRIADDYPNGWTMGRADFEKQIKWLQARVDLVSLEELQRRLRQGNRRPAVSITFDDGYAENCEFALPLLIRKKIPCTYFVTTRNMFTGQPFPHDLAAGSALPPNTVEQIRSLADAGIEIGAHTQTHADLGKLHDLDRLRAEVIESGQELENVTGRPVRYFAFPFGQPQHLNNAAYRLAQEAGYEAVCTTQSEYLLPGDDPFVLPRLHADPLWERFENWLSFDPRKLWGRKPLISAPASIDLNAEHARELAAGVER